MSSSFLIVSKVCKRVVLIWLFSIDEKDLGLCCRRTCHLNLSPTDELNAFRRKVDTFGHEVFIWLRNLALRSTVEVKTTPETAT